MKRDSLGIINLCAYMDLQGDVSEMTVRLNPYLTMDGNAKEAVHFYVQALGAEVVASMTFGDMPADPNSPPLPEAAKGLVAHALLKVGGTDLMISDTFPGQPVHSGNRVTVCVTCSDAERARKVWDALEKGGQVVMPLQQTFWSPAYGIVTDKFGVTFQVTAEHSA